MQKSGGPPVAGVHVGEAQATAVSTSFCQMATVAEGIRAATAKVKVDILPAEIQSLFLMLDSFLGSAAQLHAAMPPEMRKVVSTHVPADEGPTPTADDKDIDMRDKQVGGTGGQSD